MILPHKIYLAVANYINLNFKEARMLLSDYLFQNGEHLKNELSNNISDEFCIYDLADTNDKYYENFIEKFIKDEKKWTRVCLEEYKGEYYLKVSNYGKNIDNNIYKNVLEKMKSIEDPYFFEEICAFFLQDMGVKDIFVTPQNGDFGIDVLGKLNIENSISTIFNNQFINILCQVKLHNSAIDTPYIRRIISDSLFIRFDSDIYPEVNHHPIMLIVISKSGFTKTATKYAQKKGVKLLNLIDMVEYLSKFQDIKESYTYQFLWDKLQDK